MLFHCYPFAFIASLLLLLPCAVSSFVSGPRISAAAAVVSDFPPAHAAAAIDQLPLLPTSLEQPNSNKENAADEVATTNILTDELLLLISRSPNPILATIYARSILDLEQEISSHEHNFLQQAATVSDLMPPPVYGEMLDKPPSLPHSFTFQLKLFGSMAAAAYCMSWNIVPEWKCGYPRCSNPEITLDSLVNVDDSRMFPQFFARLTTDSPLTIKRDVLAATRPLRYIESAKTSVVGFIAVNELLNLVSFHREIDEHVKTTIVVSFRGSLHPKNFFYDLQIAQVDFEYPDAPTDSKIHSGFWKVWSDLEEQVVDGVREAIESVMSDGNRHHIEIVFTGHSLGGSVAMLGGLMFRRMAMRHEFPGLHNLPVTTNDSDSDEEEKKSGIWRFKNAILSLRVYTFGQPRTGNRIFADWVSTLPGFPVFRTTFFNDIIVHLPPKKLGPPKEEYQFHHHASEYFIMRSKATVMCDDMTRTTAPVGEHPSCSNGVRKLSILSHLTYWEILYGPWC